MKRLLRIGFFALFCAYALSSTGQDLSFLTNGLVAYYPFNGNGLDASGKGHDANVSDYAFGAGFNGETNRAIVFPYAKWIAVPDAPDFDTETFTVSASVYLSASTVHDNSLPRFFGKRYDFLNGRFEVGVQNANLGVPNGSFSAMVRFSDFTAIWISGKTLSTPERWAHVVFVKSTNYIELFINGVSEAKASIPEKAMLQTTGPLAIGSNGWVGPEQSWTGRMQNARYYNRALSPDEAQLLFQHDTGRPLQVPRRATGIAQVVNGFVVGIMVTDGGSGYTNAPVVYITGLGSGAQGIATITNGVVTGITITQTGSGYTSVPDVRIASPPFYPTLSIATSKVKVTQNVVLGRKYLLQASIDLSTWSNVGNPFIATDESITVELDVEVVGKYFRIQQVP